MRNKTKIGSKNITAKGGLELVSTPLPAAHNKSLVSLLSQEINSLLVQWIIVLFTYFSLVHLI